MAEQISYFDVTTYLVDIEAEFADVSDPTKRTQGLVERLLEKWPTMSPDQAVAYVKVFDQSE